jgi:DNA-directed RNA polymerase specialized sigma24 family protein
MRAAGSEPASYAAFVAANAGRALRLARRWTGGDGAWAEEVAADALALMGASWTTIAPADRHRDLGGFVRAAGLQARRDAGNRPTREQPADPATLAMMAGTIGPADDHTETRQFVAAVLDRLSAGDRRALLCRDGEDWPYATLAAVEGVSEQAARARVARARQRFRAVVETMDEGLWAAAAGLWAGLRRRLARLRPDYAEPAVRAVAQALAAGAVVAAVVVAAAPLTGSEKPTVTTAAGASTAAVPDPVLSRPSGVARPIIHDGAHPTPTPAAPPTPAPPSSPAAAVVELDAAGAAATMTRERGSGEEDRLAVLLVVRDSDGNHYVFAKHNHTCGNDYRDYCDAVSAAAVVDAAVP